MMSNAHYECTVGRAFVFQQVGTGGARVFVDTGVGESVHVSVLFV